MVKISLTCLRRLTSDRSHVIKNLAFNIGVTQSIFLLGAHQTHNKVNKCVQNIVVEILHTKILALVYESSADFHPLLSPNTQILKGVIIHAGAR